ncbi:Uncharacterised protein [Porphyromonas macacae]|uniref:Cell division protein FtsQ n=1 Tax=Porphyromonas macacae TaxID=28115 RepID=A0A379E6N5_9PORP|nr:hypothetical protein [Porphyromonas macacae]SUB87984.1 Uncharacterised protein [Porphyromonas macacae]
MIKKILYIIGFFLLLAYLSVVVYFALRHRPSGKCSGVDVEMISKSGQIAFMTRDDVRKELELMKFDLPGKELGTINIYEVEENLRKNPLFSNTQVYLSPVSKSLVLQIEQKSPMFIVQAGDSVYYISTDRGIIPCNPRYAVEVPLVTGHVERDYALGAVYDLIKIIKNDSYWQNFFTQVYVRKDGNIILTPRLGTMQIIMGTTPKWRTKLHNLRAFCDEVIPRVGWEAYKSLNLEFNGQVIAKSVDGSPAHIGSPKE